ncbi:MAG: Rieske 2Fe-2S domain-containing protein [Bauldia sp.]|nr:Rieske 2Fe-2S domain-containing protein [Bauldia sp.]
MTDVVLDLADLPPGTMKTIDLGGTEVVVANVDGACFAFGGICPHEGGSLGDGELRGAVVTCPWHGARFDVRTGAVIDGYTPEPVPVFEVRTEGEQLRVICR